MCLCGGGGGLVSVVIFVGGWGRGWCVFVFFGFGVLADVAGFVVVVVSGHMFDFFGLYACPLFASLLEFGGELL